MYVCLEGALVSVSAPALLFCGVLSTGKRTVETPFVGNVVNQQDAHGAPIIRRGNGAESLLTCRVPYLQLHALAVELNSPDLEVDADGGDEAGCERVFAKAQ
jgi:hypothetical protein